MTQTGQENSLYEDVHHCNCFSTDPRFLEILKSRLVEERFHAPPQENHGEAFGLAKDLDDTWQMHVRVFHDGRIKSEIEPRWVYLEHADRQYSFSAHAYVGRLLSRLGIVHRTIWYPPEHCVFPRVKAPKRLTNWVSVAVGAGFVIGTVALVMLASTRNKG